MQISPNKSPLDSAESTDQQRMTDYLEKTTLENIKIFLQKKQNFDPNLTVGPEQTPIICLAAKYNNKGLLEHLLKLGANINARDISKNTVLHTSIKYNNSLVDYLLQNGADPNLQNKLGYPPLYTAITNCNETSNEISTIKLLFKYGANINHHTNFSSPLGDLVDKHYSYKINESNLENLVRLKTLCNLGASLTDVNTKGDTVFHRAMGKQRVVFKTLITNACFNFKKEYTYRIKTFLMILNRHNKLLYSNKDLQFLILAKIPEYFSHEGLYKKFSTHELKLFPFYQVNGHVQCIQNILQIKNSYNEKAFDLLPQFEDEEYQKKITSLFNEKLPADLAEFNQKYPDTQAIQENNLARQIHVNYNF